MATRNIKWAILLACLLLPIILHAKDDVGFYTMFELGAYKDYIQSKDKRTKANQTVGKIYAQWGYEWQSGWQLGIEGTYAGVGATHNLSGIYLMRGSENLPYHHNDGVVARDMSIAFLLGYHLIRSTDHDMYIRFLWNFLDASLLSYAFPFVAQQNTGGFKIEIENRHSLVSKMSLGYTFGVSSSLGNDILFSSIDNNDYVRLGAGDDDIEARIDYITWGLYGNIKWIYHASNRADFFVKWDIQARFVPKSEEVRTSVYDILNRRSLGEVSLYTPSYRNIRSGISFGFAF